MVMKKETGDYYFLLEERKKLARKNAITLGFPFTLALLALYGLIFYPFDVMSTMSWIFGSYRSPLLISFSTILLLLFSIFIGLFLTVYLWKYISIKKIMKEFNR
jgi:ABC-type Mn2+/Zn2+ transport system permease subunit